MKHQGPEWLRNAVAYQIFVPSFCDSNGDGIGDVPGVTSKLDYIKSSGFNAIWLTPVFESPFQDAGYDISDFYKVAPRFGTKKDLEKLFKEAHKRGIRVLLDLVAGHTSIEHPWFQASCKPKENEYTNWYVWTDDVFRRYPGMDFIRGYGDRPGAFLPNYYYFQASLNYGFYKPDPKQPWQLPVDHPDVQAVRAELKKIMRYWLDAGCDGFRVDMAHSLVKGDPDKKGTMQLWRDVRAMLDADYPDAAMVSEWSNAEQSLKAGFHMDFLIHQRTDAFVKLLLAGPDSFLSENDAGDITHFLDYFMPKYRKTRNDGFICMPTSNHDICRMAAQRKKSEIEVAFAFLLTMPGVPFVYYGEELGMKPAETYVGKEGGYTRNGSRTPMPWTTGKNAGFSSAAPSRLYLPISETRKSQCVESQVKNKNSIWNHVRTLIEIRRNEPALHADGKFEPLYAKKKKCPFVYLRRQGNERVLVAVNPNGKPSKATFEVPGRIKEPTSLASCGAEIKHQQGRRFTIEMSGSSYAIYKF